MASFEAWYDTGLYNIDVFLPKHSSLDLSGQSQLWWWKAEQSKRDPPPPVISPKELAIPVLCASPSRLLSEDHPGVKEIWRYRNAPGSERKTRFGFALLMFFMVGSWSSNVDSVRPPTGKGLAELGLTRRMSRYDIRFYVILVNWRGHVQEIFLL